MRMRRKPRRHDATGRSTSEGHFVQLFSWMLETRAMCNLSPAAFKVLVYMAKRFYGDNNGRIAFGVRSGCFVRQPGGPLHHVEVSIGLSSSRKAHALKELEQAGFIVCVKPSSFDQKRRVKEWRLTWHPCGGQPATKEFAHSAPPKSKIQSVRKHYDATDSSPDRTAQDAPSA